MMKRNFYTLILLVLIFLDLVLLKEINTRQCKCGKSLVHSVGRIINGRPTKPHQYPWMAAMYVDFRRKSFRCGGSIISNRHVITAGHCIFYAISELSQSFWLLGMHYEKSGAFYKPIKANLHPRFTNKTNYDDYDISIVTLNREILFDDYILPICLPKITDDFSGKYLKVAGWGRLNEKIRKTSPILMATDVKVIDQEECMKMMPIFEYEQFNVESMVCAYRKNTDSCQGDSGGPLFYENAPNHYVLYGLVSFGEGCGKGPGVYAKINSQFTLTWIYKTVRENQGLFCYDY